MFYVLINYTAGDQIWGEYGTREGAMVAYTYALHSPVVRDVKLIESV